MGVKRLSALAVSASAIAALFATTLLGATGEQGRAPTHVHATLNARAQVPGPSVEAPRAKGIFVGRLRGTTLGWRLTFHGLTSRTSSAHLHVGRPRARGAVAARLCSPCRLGVSGTARLTAAEAEKARSGMVYVDVHTRMNPGGEIRGQVAVGLVPTLEILSPADGEKMILPARVRYAVTGFGIGPRAGHIVAIVGGTRDDIRVELQLTEEPGLAYLPDHKLLAGKRELTFALVRADGTELANPEAHITVYRLTVVGRR